MRSESLHDRRDNTGCLYDYHCSRCWARVYIPVDSDCSSESSELRACRHPYSNSTRNFAELYWCDGSHPEYDRNCHQFMLLHDHQYSDSGRSVVLPDYICWYGLYSTLIPNEHRLCGCDCKQRNAVWNQDVLNWRDMVIGPDSR